VGRASIAHRGSSSEDEAMQVVSEAHRIDFLLRRDGLEATIAWVWRTLRIYRAAVLDKNHHASSAAFRPNFIQSCCDFRRWLSEMHAYDEPGGLRCAN
jgi:hypothetical protein